MTEKGPYNIPSTDMPWEPVESAIFMPPKNSALTDKIKYIAEKINTKWPDINNIMMTEKISSSSPHKPTQKTRAMRAVYVGKDKKGGFKYRLEAIY